MFEIKDFHPVGNSRWRRTTFVLIKKICNGTSDFGTSEYFCAGFCLFEIKWNPSMKNISLFFLIFLKYASISLAACGTRLIVARQVSRHRPEKSVEWDKIAEGLSEAFSDGENFV